MTEYLEFVGATEHAIALLKQLRDKGWDARAISIAIMHLETAQLWAANAMSDEVGPAEGDAGR